MLKLLSRAHRGDTIVEVMVVLAILGLAIGISYATANSSLLATRGAQESSEASEILQAQLELLREAAKDTTSGVYSTSGIPFCLDPSNGSVAAFGSANPTLTDYRVYPDTCVFSSLYHVSIRYDANAATDDSFTAVAYWDDVQGQGQDSVTLIYRIRQ